MSKAQDSSFDFAVIGGGSAGYAAARTAVAEGLSTVVIDGADELGGLCILRGCMPSKALIASANTALHVRRAPEFGVDATLRKVDTAAVRKRKRALIEDFAGYRQGQLKDGRFTLVRGTAAFTDPHTLEVRLRDGGLRHIRAKAFLIATGSVISFPDLPGLADAKPWTSDTVLDAAEVPESFIVLGGGAIALEMAHYLEGIGRKVTVIQRGVQLLTGMDTDVAEVVEKSFRHRGMTLHTGTKLISVSAGHSKKTVTFTTRDGEEQTAHAAEILLALGRRPAIAGLALEAAGVFVEHRHVAVTPSQQTGVPHIFAAGDVCGEIEVVHIAIQQAEIAARNAARLLRGEPASECMDYRLKLYGVFTEPQVAAVGMTEAEAAASGRPWKSATYPFDDHGKSMVEGKTEGFVKLIADTGTGEILGASVVGPEAVELIHTAVAAMHFKATAKDFAGMPFYHPTLSEIWSYPAEELADG